MEILIELDARLGTGGLWGKTQGGKQSSYWHFLLLEKKERNSLVVKKSVRTSQIASEWQVILTDGKQCKKYRGWWTDMILDAGSDIP